MMHQWQSLEKLVKQWEEQEVKNRFEYEEFKYELDEWDNVPPVLPRFQFYIQNCLKQSIEFSKEVKERQTTEELRTEMYTNFDKHGNDLKNEETARISDITKATARKDDI
jgi:hypothetical protein